MDSSEVLKFRILICLLVSAPSNCSVSGVSRTLKEAKYKISRMMIRLEKEGLIDRSDVRQPTLTEEGKKTAERYQERTCLAQNHLLYEGMDLESAKKNASMWAIYGTDELINIIRESDERFRVKSDLRKEAKFSGSLLCEKLKDGIYSFPFIIYRERVKDNNNISMANSGFEHPCSLCVKNNVGVIQLHVLSMSQRSSADGSILHGKVNKMEYFDSGRFISAEFHGDVISFPADCLNFINIGTGVGQILHGSVCLKMQCSVGPVHMPESKALFTILI